MVSSTPRPHFTPGKEPVPILQEAGWTPGPVWRGGKSRPHRDSIPDRPAGSQSLYRLSHPAHRLVFRAEIIPDQKKLKKFLYFVCVSVKLISQRSFLPLSVMAAKTNAEKPKEKYFYAVVSRINSTRGLLVHKSQTP